MKQDTIQQTEERVQNGEKVLVKLLKIVARAILHKYKPTIIAITGSVGKTSTKEAIYSVVRLKHSVRQSTKNYNNEIGVPLSILNCDTANKSIIGWLHVFFKSITMLLFHDTMYPSYLILELGADRPGDIVYLRTIINPDIAIITFIFA